MKYKVLSLFDLVGREYQPPMYVPSIPVAMRDLGDQLTDPANKAAAARHPEQFEIHCLADFDSETGKYQERPDKFLYAVTDFLPKKQ